MTGKTTRSKGRRGETAAKNLLASRDWIVSDLSAGVYSEDLLATDPNGVEWSVEVKNTQNIALAHRKQAIKQANDKKLPWMLMSHISGTSSWLVQRKNHVPVVWSKNNDGLSGDKEA